MVERLARIVQERTLLEQCRYTIHRLVPKATIILYGSRARGDAKPASDYDLLILVDGEISPDLEETIGNALYHIELEWEVVIPAIVFNRKEWNQDRFKVLPLHRNIDREGIVL